MTCVLGRPLGEETRATVMPSVYSRPFGEESVLLDFGGGEYFALDAVGTMIFGRIGCGECLGEIADAIAAAYEVERAVALTDIVALVTQLLGEGTSRSHRAHHVVRFGLEPP